MKKNVLLIIVCFMSIIAMANTGDVVNLIRAKIEKVVLLLSQDERDAPEHVYEFGYDYRRKTGYEDMASAVSNDFIQVFSNFNECATNYISRLVLLSSAWAYDQNYYFQSLSNALELASQNVITAKEFKWVRMMSDNIEFLSYLSNEYMKPSVSNLVVKMMSVTGETNYCHRILSGEAKRDVQKILDSMAEPIKDVAGKFMKEGPESP